MDIGPDNATFVPPGTPHPKDAPRDERGRLYQQIVLVGDIVNGFEAYGPFDSGHDAVTWKQSTGPRELCQGQWYLMRLNPPFPGKD